MVQAMELSENTSAGSPSILFDDVSQNASGIDTYANNFNDEEIAEDADLFGGDLSGAEPDAEETKENSKIEDFNCRKYRPDANLERSDLEGHSAEIPEEVIERHVIDVTIPPVNYLSGKDEKLYHWKVPGFLKIEPAGFDRAQFVTKYKSGELKSDENTAAYTKWRKDKLRVNNTIRWRYKADSNNKIESNARYVQWSDGSNSLILGDCYYDMKIETIRSSSSHLVLSYENAEILYTNRRFEKLISVYPKRNAFSTHVRLNNGVKVLESSQHSGVREIITENDPEKTRREAELAEAERNKARRRLEIKQYAREKGDPLFNSNRFYRRSVVPENIPTPDEGHENSANINSERLQYIKREGAKRYSEKQANVLDHDAEYDSEEYISNDEDDKEQLSTEQQIDDSSRNRDQTLNSLSNDMNAKRIRKTDEIDSRHTEENKDDGQSATFGKRRRVLESDDED